VIHVPDVDLDPEYGSPEMSRAVGFRGILAVPMLRDGVPLGVIAVGRLAQAISRSPTDTQPVFEAIADSA
jgi:GAF domain-containing protein